MSTKIQEIVKTLGGDESHPRFAWWKVVRGPYMEHRCTGWLGVFRWKNNQRETVVEFGDAKPDRETVTRLCNELPEPA